MRGIAVLRIAARDVLGNLEGVLVTIEQRARASPLHRRVGGPPPPVGEEC